MVRQEAPDWVTALILIIVLGALFPAAAAVIFQSVILAIFLGVFVAVVIIILWFILSRYD